MTDIITPPNGLVFLTFSDEIVPLLKRGLIPLSAPEHSDLPGYEVETGPQLAAVSEEDYQRHMRAEYQRLPANLQGLLTFDAFLTQAQGKRALIEQAMVDKQRAQAQLQQGQPQDWLWREGYSDASCALAWSQAGYGSVWLGIDVQQWPQAEFHAVRYESHWPLTFPERLQFDAPQRSPLAQQRLILPRAEVDKTIQVGGQTQWLLYLPPKAIRLVLLGGRISPRLKSALLSLLSQDFRYQRIERAQMTLSARTAAWQFSRVR